MNVAALYVETNGVYFGDPPDTQEQHPLDVVACFADEPRLAVAPEPAPVQAKPQNGALTSPA